MAIEILKKMLLESPTQLEYIYDNLSNATSESLCKVLTELKELKYNPDEKHWADIDEAIELITRILKERKVSCDE